MLKKVKEMNVHFYSFIFLCLFLFAVKGFSQTPDSTPVPGETRSSADLIHFGDLIEIDVIGSFEFDWRGGLGPEGFLYGFDKVEAEIYGLCKSEAELSALLEPEYAKTLNHPKVVVRILDRSNRAVAFLDGAIKFPQRFQIKRPVNLNELLILSGGLTDNASGEISIFRPQNLNCQASVPVPAEQFVNASSESGPNILRIKISDLLRGLKEANPQILSGDIITVVEAFPIYVIGGVNAPKQISSRSQMTLTRAIATAGGLAKEAEGSSATIFRREGNESRVIEADLEKIRAGTAADPILKAFDIIEVPQKGRPKRKFPPVIDKRIGPGNANGKLPLRIID